MTYEEIVLRDAALLQSKAAILGRPELALAAQLMLGKLANSSEAMRPRARIGRRVRVRPAEAATARLRQSC